MLSHSNVSVGTVETIAWRRALVALALGCIITLVGFRQTVVSMTTIWVGSATYSYCLLIVPIVGVLIWRLRDQVRDIIPTCSFAGLTAYFCSVLVWFSGNVADVQIVQQVALVAMLDSLVWAMLGTAVATSLRFPLGFLCLTVPFGDGIVPTLQQGTATVVVAALRLSGIPAFQDGFVLLTPNGNWQVAEACSGIRYLIASIVIGVLVAGVAYKSWKRRIIFLLLSVLLPIVANAIRAYGIVVLAYLTSNAIATGVDHVIYGFVFFSLTTALLLTVAIRWYEPVPNRGPRRVNQVSNAPNSALLVANVLAIVVAVVSAGAASEFLWSRTPATPGAAAFVVPVGWTPVRNLDDEWAPEPKALRQRTTANFSSGLNQVATCFGWYPEGRRGVELINETNLVGESGVWTVLGSGTRQVVIRGEPVVVAEYQIKRGPERRLVWVWYSIGGQITSSPYHLRLIEASDRLRGRPQGTSLYAVSAPYQSDPLEASNALDSFLK